MHAVLATFLRIHLITKIPLEMTDTLSENYGGRLRGVPHSRSTCDTAPAAWKKIASTTVRLIGVGFICLVPENGPSRLFRFVLVTP